MAWQAPFSDPLGEPFPRTLPRTFSEPSEHCVAVRPVQRAPNFGFCRYAITKAPDGELGSVLFRIL